MILEQIPTLFLPAGEEYQEREVGEDMDFWLSLAFHLGGL
jgi:hypothetical protein